MLFVSCLFNAISIWFSSLAVQEWKNQHVHSPWQVILLPGRANTSNFKMYFLTYTILSVSRTNEYHEVFTTLQCSCLLTITHSLPVTRNFSSWNRGHRHYLLQRILPCPFQGSVYVLHTGSPLPLSPPAIPADYAVYYSDLCVEDFGIKMTQYFAPS